VARALIVGCGCRGRALAVRLAAEGLAVRGTSRGAAGLDEIEAAGFEAAEADPMLPGSLLELVGDVALVVWLLGSAAGDGEPASGVNGERLESLLARLVDTPVRGFVYEAAGSAPADSLSRGRELVADASATWSIPVAFIEEAPAGDWGAWSGAAATTALDLLR
jgi:nucleoside-diphosphate-sugar epimerase